MGEFVGELVKRSDRSCLEMLKLEPIARECIETALGIERYEPRRCAPGAALAA
jgi:hypothetical protein